jgi:uncharacterized protein (TIGR03437 family)
MKHRYFSSVLFLFAALVCHGGAAQTVRFQTNMGNMDVVLLPESAPLTVANFLNYVNRGAYNNSFFHRSVPGFIIQGGGFTFGSGGAREIPADPPVRNEFNVSNTRGTLAMAKLGSDPNSATNQWFFNLANNAGNLNNQNGGFTVFGRVADAAGLAVMDRIAAVPVYRDDAPNSPFQALPLQNYRGGNITASHLVIVTAITVLEPEAAISENGVVSASGFGGFAVAAAGSYIEIYGSNLAGATRAWTSEDFSDRRAPTALEGVTVTVDGKPAYINFVSPSQVNVQVPAGVPAGRAVPVVVSYGGASSAAAMLEIRETAPGLLAPASFKVEDRQYVTALHYGTGAFVSNGSVPNVPAAPAAPGETLTFYGIGFGPVTPGEVAGEIAEGTTNMTLPVEFRFGDIPAQVLYSGLAPGLVGVYQFNVVVPADAPRGDTPLNVMVGGERIAQTLFIPVQAP